MFVHLNSFAIDLKTFQRPDPNMESFTKNLAKEFDKITKKEATAIALIQEIPDWIKVLEERSQGLVKDHFEPDRRAEPSDFYIFASLSLKQKHLKALVQDAKRFKGVVVVRGLKNNSLQETIAYLQSVLRKDHEGIQIDPTLFRKYNVTTVPTFVLARMDLSDILRGNVTARFALSKMQANGDLALEARQRLSHAK